MADELPREPAGNPEGAEAGNAPPLSTLAPDCPPTQDVLPTCCPTPSELPPHEAETAPYLLGPYRILAPLGQGGMGTVYRAVHTHLGKVVALKLLSAHRTTQPELIARFRQEMQAVGRLRHPNIVQAYDAAVDGVPYLAMELLDGIDLAELVRRVGPLPVADACEALLQAAVGLQHAHENGLVHRDLKPSNLMLTPDGVVKVLDLGLARVLGERPAEPTPEPPAEGPIERDLTAVGQLLGTPDYMAPEQIRDPRGADIRSDLYSLGCTLFHLLTGSAPFRGPGYDTPRDKLQAHLGAAPPSVRAARPDVPAAVEAMLSGLLAKEPGQRPATPGELVRALSPWTAGADLRALARRAAGTAEAAANGASTVRFPPPVALRPAAGRRRRLVLLGAGLLLVAALTAAILWRGASGPPTVGPPPELAVLSFKVEHWRQEGKSAAPLGTVGVPSFRAIRLGDLLRVSVRLSEPAYCYLIACHPDGKHELCHTETGRPPPHSSLYFPTDPSSFSRLSDGIGLEAFVLVVSRRPLPDYAEWEKRLGEFPWRNSPADGPWRYDGHWFEPLDGVRGEEHKLPVPPPLVELCRFLEQRGGADIVHAVAFPVR
jgi:hypothetical protein